MAEKSSHRKLAASLPATPVSFGFRATVKIFFSLSIKSRKALPLALNLTHSSTAGILLRASGFFG
jgi:hypothetical protein